MDAAAPLLRPSYLQSGISERPCLPRISFIRLTPAMPSGALYERLSFYENPEGWGPPLDLGPDRYRHVPYAPFTRLERLGRVADFAGAAAASQIGNDAQSVWAAEEDTREDELGRRGRRHQKATPRERGRASTGLTNGLGDEESALATTRFTGAGSRSAGNEGFTLVEGSGRERAAQAGYGAYREQQRSGYGGGAGAARGGAPARRTTAAALARGGAVALTAAGSSVSGAFGAGKQTSATTPLLGAAGAPTTQLARTGNAQASNRDESLLSPFVDAVPLLTLEGTSQWTLLVEIPFAKLIKMELGQDIPEAEMLCERGAVSYYDKSCDRISCKQPRPLASFEQRKRLYPTVNEDPRMQSYRSDLEHSDHGAADAPTEKRRVLTTGPLLALLMAAPKSSYPWDVVVERHGNVLVIDRRPDSQVETLTMFETITDNSQRSGLAFAGANMLFALQQAQSNALEAARINHNFSQSVLRADLEPYRFAGESPFTDSATDAVLVGYRYRRWELSDELELIARCEVDAALETTGPAFAGESTAPALILLRALNEIPDTNVRAGGSSGSAVGAAGATAGGGVGDWRTRLDAQRGSVLATELRNHTAKLVRWTVLALIAGADQLKLGFVSRVNPRDTRNHVILGMQAYKPNEFAKQIGVNTRNMWGIMNHLVQACFSLLADGERAILTKEAHRQSLRLYRMPSVLEGSESNQNKS
jgi:translation initiation factor 3 subunit D